MFKTIIFSFIFIFSFSCFSATLTIRSQYPIQNVDNAPIGKTAFDYGRLKLISYEPREGCLIPKETAKQSGYSLGELQILASMDDVEIICRTDGSNEWGDYICQTVEVNTKPSDS